MREKSRKLLALLLSAALLAGVAACGEATPQEVPEESRQSQLTETSQASGNESENRALTQVSGSYIPGTYTGEAPGRNGVVRVDVTVDETSILSAQVTEHAETATLSDAPVQQIPRQIVETQSLAVDAIAGATLTSDAVVAAITDALTQAGADIGTLMTRVAGDTEQAQDDEAEIVVVGAGAAGMIAAIRATEAGKKVILVEKMGMLGGGDTMLASTSIRAGGTKLVEELEIENATAQDFYEHLMAEATAKEMPVDEDNIRAYALRSGAVVDWLTQLGVPFKRFNESSFSHITEDGSAPGTHIVAALSKQLDALGVDYRLNTRATSILMNDGSASGITVEGPGGDYSIASQAVIICTGGFSANQDLLAEYNPTWLNRPTTGAASLTGDGILMAQAVGADIYNMDVVKANYLCHVLPSGDGVSLTAITNYCLLVNHDGKRFVNEGHPSINYKSEQMMEQEGSEAYAIFDQTVIEELKLMSGYNDAGYFLSANTLEELADLIDVDKDNFLETMENYHRYAENGEDEEFDRNITDAVDQPKFYAALVTPSMQSTYGGIRVDVDGRAISTEGEVIPGLYAAGATSGHDCFASEVGAALIIAVAYGDIVAEAVVADLQ